MNVMIVIQIFVFICIIFLCPRPHSAEALCNDDCCLSVCLSVPCLTLSREWKGIGSWKVAGGKLMTRVTC